MDLDTPIHINLREVVGMSAKILRKVKAAVVLVVLGTLHPVLVVKAFRKYIRICRTTRAIMAASN